MPIYLKRRADCDIVYCRHLGKKFFFRHAGHDFAAGDLHVPAAVYKRFVRALARSGRTFSLKKLYLLSGIKKDHLVSLLTDFVEKGILDAGGKKPAPLSISGDAKETGAGKKAFLNSRVVFVGGDRLTRSLIFKFVSYGLARDNAFVFRLDERSRFSPVDSMRLRAAISDSDLTVLSTGCCGRKRSSLVNGLCIELGRPLLNVVLYQDEAMVGPVLIRNATPCYVCLDTRLKEGDFKEYEYLLRREVPKGAAGRDLFFDRIAETAARLSRIVLSGKAASSYTGKVFSVDRYRGGARQHHLLRKDGCPCCSRYLPKDTLRYKGFSIPRSAIISLDGRRLVAYRENGLRVVSAAQTLRAVRRLRGRLGIINLQLKDNRGGKIRVLVADPMGNNVRRSSGGKGFSGLQMRSSAAMEAVERYCSKMHPHDAVITAAYRQVKERAKDPRDFPISRYFPVRFTPDLPIDWVWGYSLVRRHPVLVPANFAYCCYAPRPGAHPIDYFWNSNGLGCGNCMEEAILHGFLELVERDACFIVYQNRLVMPDVDPAGFRRNRLVDGLLLRFERAGIAWHIKSFTTDIGIPSFAVLLCGRTGRYEGFGFAVGTHLDPEIALVRALTESEQLYPRFRQNSLWLRTSPIDHLLRKGQSTLGIKDFCNLAAPGLKDNIAFCIKKLNAYKSDVIVVNFTRPEIGFSVVKVMVDSLQPFYVPAYPRYVERMFTVPRLLGFRKDRSSESELANGVMCGMAEGMRGAWPPPKRG